MKFCTFIISCFVIIAMYGCGGSGGSSDSTGGQSQQVSAPSNGVFTDSPVSGVSYRTASISGVTGANGEFQYYPGESVTFYIGDVILGNTPASSKVTPIDLSPSKNDTNPTTLNIARFIQSLDSDGNLDNGIQITQEIRAELVGRNIDFSRSTTDFNDANMQALFTSMNSKNLFTSGSTRSLVTDLAAQYNLRHSLNPTVNPFDADWSANYQYPSNTGGSGTTITVGGVIIPPIPDVPNQDTSKVVISGSTVTFTPITGTTVSGSINSSGIISIPNRTINCKDPFGNNLILYSNVTLNYDGTINGDWQIGLPIAAAGYCYPHRVTALFHKDISIIPPTIITPTIILPNDQNIILISDPVTITTIGAITLN